MSDKPEALRLAHLLERIDGQHWQVLDSAADELRRLHAENFVLAAGQCVNVTSDEGGTPRCAEIARLHAECEALRKDAGRLDWINENPDKLSRSTGYRGSASTWTVRDCDGVAHDFRSIRNAIDLARQQ